MVNKKALHVKQVIAERSPPPLMLDPTSDPTDVTWCSECLRWEPNKASATRRPTFERPESHTLDVARDVAEQLNLALTAIETARMVDKPTSPIAMNDVVYPGEAALAAAARPHLLSALKLLENLLRPKKRRRVRN